MSLPPRQVTNADIQPLAELWWAGWHEAHAVHVPNSLVSQRTLKSFRTRLQSMGDSLRTAGPVGAPDGFCAISNQELDQLYVAPSARGTGLAGRLLQDGETRLIKEGVKRAHLHCLPQNTTAARFYANHGWRETGLFRDIVHGDNGGFALDVIRFEKDLSQT